MTSPDPFTRWRELVLSAQSERYRPERDLAFWHAKAAAYDANQPPLPNTLRWLAGELRGLDSLLEVGAGTGRLLLPLAEAVPHVTALDYSPEMLAQLRAKHPPSTLQTVCCSLEEAPQHVPPHDAVLAAWALPYQSDLKTALEMLRSLAGHCFYLLEDDGVGSPHANLRRSLAHKPRPGRATLLREAVAALGWRFQRQVVTERRELWLEDDAALLALARLPLPDAQALAALAPYLTREKGGWRYGWAFEVEVLRVEV